MAYGVRLEVWGDYASFNRPEMKVERVSYEVMTPSAARGILEAIYWKPEMRWIIDRIRVLAPIEFTHVRRNEIDTKIPVKGNTGVEVAMREGSGALGISVEAHRQQRAAMILRGVRYGIEAHVQTLETTDGGGARIAHPEAKHLDMFKRRASKGQYFHHPYLGCREFPAFFRLLSDEESFRASPEELRGQRELGYMLWDVEFQPDPQGSIVESSQGQRVSAMPRFFHARMADGVIEVPSFDEMRG
ncbi:type I-C CRISPR-associated protein Cas5 [Candidatus Fermentibacteria bacterium]|nr:type I-C CRISPR-associated protein Cas5 [Candidatus Fermentibacteria bacterium]